MKSEYFELGLESRIKEQKEEYEKIIDNLEFIILRIKRYSGIYLTAQQEYNIREIIKRYSSKKVKERGRIL